MEQDLRAYYSSTDVEVILQTHPDPEVRAKPVDAAHFILTAGSNPIHIWNYAQRDDSTQAQALQIGVQGGAPFDDTAIGNTIVQLQLVMNLDRLNHMRGTFAPLTNIGDVIIRYKGVASWGEIQETGYILLDGHVSQIGSEVTVRNATYPSVTLVFKDISSINARNVSLFESNIASFDEEFPLDGPESGSEVTYDSYNVQYQADDQFKQYHPEFGKLDKDKTLVVSQDLSSQGRKSFTIKGTPTEYIESSTYEGAVIELLTNSSRVLYVWHLNTVTGEGYKKVKESPNVGGPLIVNNRIDDNLLSDISTALFDL